MNICLLVLSSFYLLVFLVVAVFAEPPELFALPCLAAPLLAARLLSDTIVRTQRKPI